MIDALVLKLTDFLLTFLQKEEHMLFIGGFILGAVIGGLFTQFVLPMIWKPKSGG